MATLALPTTAPRPRTPSLGTAGVDASGRPLSPSTISGFASVINQLNQSGQVVTPADTTPNTPTPTTPTLTTNTATSSATTLPAPALAALADQSPTYPATPPIGRPGASPSLDQVKLSSKELSTSPSQTSDDQGSANATALAIPASVLIPTPPPAPMLMPGANSTAPLLPTTQSPAPLTATATLSTTATPPATILPAAPGAAESASLAAATSESQPQAAQDPAATAAAANSSPAATGTPALPVAAMPVAATAPIVGTPQPSQATPSTSAAAPPSASIDLKASAPTSTEQPATSVARMVITTRSAMSTTTIAGTPAKAASPSTSAPSASLPTAPASPPVTPATAAATLPSELNANNAGAPAPDSTAPDTTAPDTTATRPGTQPNATRSTATNTASADNQTAATIIGDNESGVLVVPQATTPSITPMMPSPTPLVAASGEARPISSSAVPPSPAAQVAQALVEPVKVVLTSPAPTSSTATHVTTIQIAPAELGRVDIRIERTLDGPAKIQMIAERPETLSRLVHDQSHLHEALDQAGLTATNRTIEFSLAPTTTDTSALNLTSGSFSDQNTSGNNGFQRHGSRYPNQATNLSDETTTGSTVTPRAVRSGIDITA